jgi:Zn-dependent alcohol dehydrogenase
METYPDFTTAIVADAPKDGCVQWRKAKVELRELLDDEILVRVVASGICHTDVAMSLVPSDAPGYAPYPKVLGHEGSGIVERTGAAVQHVKTGDMVLLSFDYCNEDSCRGCADQTPGYCSQFYSRNIFGSPEVYQDENGTAVAGLFFGQSSFSHLALVKGTSALNVTALVKDEEELKLFSPMGCGFQTGAAAITELADIRECDAIAASNSGAPKLSWSANANRQIFGLGSVGLAAVMVRQCLCMTVFQANVLRRPRYEELKLLSVWTECSPDWLLHRSLGRLTSLILRTSLPLQWI